MGYFSEFINESLSILDKERYELELSSKIECPKQNGWYIIKNANIDSTINREKPDCIRILANNNFLDVLSLDHTRKDILDNTVIETLYQDRIISYKYTDSKTIKISGNFLYKKNTDSNKVFSLRNSIK